MDYTVEHEMDEAQALLELRVLHGPQAGSTLPIENDKEYMLGSSETCAVLLSGAQLEAEHASLTVRGDGIEVMPMGGRVTTVDRTEVPEGEAVPLGTALRFGRVMLTIDNTDAPWPEEEVLEEPEPPRAPAQQPEAEAELPAAVEAEPAKPLAQPAASRSLGLLPSLALGATALVLLMGAALAAWMNTEEADPNGAAVAVAPASAASAAGAASAASAASAPAAAVRVPTRAQRMAAAVDFVEKHRVAGESELNVKEGAGGTLRITGAVATKEKLAELVESAQTSLADASPFEFAVLVRSQLADKFEERLRAAGIAGKFRVASREPKMELHAVLTPQEVRAWESLFIDFTRDYGSVLSISAQVQQERDAVEVRIETVMAGAFPYVVTTGGRRVAPGGTVEGHTLVAIRDGELIFADGLRVRYGN